MRQTTGAATTELLVLPALLSLPVGKEQLLATAAAQQHCRHDAACIPKRIHPIH
jgi:hypothetical protein